MSSDIFYGSHMLLSVARSAPFGPVFLNTDIDDPFSCGTAVRMHADNVITVSRRTSLSEGLSILHLPVPCLEKIFSFLEPCERGLCATVCSIWRDVMKLPRTWQHLDLNVFSVCRMGNALQHDCGVECYPAYHERMLHYIAYLKVVRPIVRQLHFALDLDEDDWHKELESLLKAARLQELQVAHMQWNETPGKPYTGLSNTIAASDLDTLNYRHRHRQRLFVHFFDFFTAAAPNIVNLRLPFDWSDRSVSLLSRLHSLRCVVLEKYSVFQVLTQDTLNLLCQCLPRVTRLAIEVYIPSGRGMQVYSFARMLHLTYLDISQCRGFYLGSLDAPSLRVIKLSRHPWNGPLVSADSVLLPCLYRVLCCGTPAIRQLNEHTLQPSWSETVYPELESILQVVCSCRNHKRSWTV